MNGTQSMIKLWADWVEPYRRMTSPESQALMREAAAALARAEDEILCGALLKRGKDGE